METAIWIMVTALYIVSLVQLVFIKDYRDELLNCKDLLYDILKELKKQGKNNELFK